MLYEFKESTEKVPGETKVLSNQKQPLLGNEKEMEIDDIKIEMLGDVSQTQAGADIKKLLAQTPSPTVRRSNNSGDMLCIGNMGTHQRAWKNDTVGATKNAQSHHTNKKKIQKDRETQS